MKKNILFLGIVSFFLFLFSLCSPSVAKAGNAYTYCDDNSLLRISTVNPPFNWLVSNSVAEIYFQSSIAIPTDEVFMKLGTSNWVTPINSSGDHRVYEYYNFNIGNDGCGYVWGNVKFRSSTDGQIHYCNLKIPKYDTGPSVANFVNSSCIGTICQYTGNPLARAAYVTGSINASGSCTGSKVYLNTIGKDFSSCSWNSDFQLTSTNGAVELYVSPQPAGGFTTAQANLQTYNYINEASCGSKITTIPTIPPNQKSICSRVTGYVKNNITKLGISGAKVTAHGIDNSIGNCQGKHYGCSVTTTNPLGYFEINCNNVADINTKCLGVYETQNPAGYTDAYGASGPTGSKVWNNNTIMLNNPVSESCGNFYFWDKTSNSSPTPTPAPICKRESSLSCAVGLCNSSCHAYCPTGYMVCESSCYPRCNISGGIYCSQPDMVCSKTYWDGTKQDTNGVNCCQI